MYLSREPCVTDQPRRYAQVQMSRRMTMSKLSKLKMADCNQEGGRLEIVNSSGSEHACAAQPQTISAQRPPISEGRLPHSARQKRATRCTAPTTWPLQASLTITSKWSAAASRVSSAGHERPAPEFARQPPAASRTLRPKPCCDRSTTRYEQASRIARPLRQGGV